jgi:hypothetical protein
LGGNYGRQRCASIFLGRTSELGGEVEVETLDGHVTKI